MTPLKLLGCPCQRQLWPHPTHSRTCMHIGLARRMSLCLAATLPAQLDARLRCPHHRHPACRKLFSIAGAAEKRDDKHQPAREEAALKIRSNRRAIVKDILQNSGLLRGRWPPSRPSAPPSLACILVGCCWAEPVSSRSGQGTCSALGVAK